MEMFIFIAGFLVGVGNCFLLMYLSGRLGSSLKPDQGEIVAPVEAASGGLEKQWAAFLTYGGKPKEGE